jgi:hypothetical protein
MGADAVNPLLRNGLAFASVSAFVAFMALLAKVMG